MKEARLQHWRASPIPAVSPGARDYAHGDEAEHAPGTFYCRRCDAFHRAPHFPLCAAPRCVGEVFPPLPAEPNDNAWQLARSLYAFTARGGMNRAARRPADAPSLLTREEKARAAALLAYWMAYPSKRWRQHGE